MKSPFNKKCCLYCICATQIPAGMQAIFFMYKLNREEQKKSCDDAGLKYSKCATHISVG